MSSLRFIFLVFLGFTLHGTGGQMRDRQRGTFIGNFKTLEHEVSGKVWAVDEDKVYIENFTFDGRSQDTFFWIGNGIQPDPRGKLIRYPLAAPDDKEVPLPRMDGEDIVLHLPPRTKITDMRWISVWVRRFTVDNGHVIIPTDLEPPRKRILPEFTRYAHSLKSGNITILDARTFYIPNLHYDGLGPDAYFWVGNGSQPGPKGHKIPNEMGSLDILRAYEGEDIELQLPENMTVYDIDYLAVWCVAYKHNFGHVLIPRPEDLWVPPALNQARVKPEEILEAYGGSDRDVYEISGPSPNDPAPGLTPQADSDYGYGSELQANSTASASFPFHHRLHNPIHIFASQITFHILLSAFILILPFSLFVNNAWL